MSVLVVRLDVVVVVTAGAGGGGRIEFVRLLSWQSLHLSRQFDINNKVKSY